MSHCQIVVKVLKELLFHFGIYLVEDWYTPQVVPWHQPTDHTLHTLLQDTISTCSSVSSNLLLIPYSVFFISITVFFSSVWVCFLTLCSTFHCVCPFFSLGLEYLYDHYLELFIG